MTLFVPTGVIAVIRNNSMRTVMTLARGLANAGVAAVEITFSVPRAEEAIRAIAGSVGVPVGAGTVRTVAQCQAAAEAGAAFIVAPDLNPAVVEWAHHHDLAAVPGALTPSEIGRCIDVGADAVKVFPAGSVGGPSYLREIIGPFPGVHLVASGGITAAQVRDYRSAGCQAVCLGRALVDSSGLAAGDEQAVTAYARKALATVY